MSRASLQQIAVASPVSRAAVTARLQRPAAPLTVIRNAATPVTTPPDEAPEASLLAFDPEEDFAGLVPMPPSIPAAIRRALTSAFAARFEHYDELDRWLHAAPHGTGGMTPWEQIMAGDGVGVLSRLSEPGSPEP